MKIHSRYTRCLAGLAAFLFCAGATAQDGYPARPIKIISPSSPGGPTDVVARMLADKLAPVLKVPVVVENKPGGTGAVGLGIVAKAPPDGYTLLVSYVSASVIHPLLNNKLPFDARKDFTPIVQVFSGASTFMAHPSVPAQNLQEFIKYAKSQPTPITYGSFGTGSSAHLSGEYLQMLTGIKMTHVPYKSATSLVNDMVAGHVMVGFLDSTNSVAQLKAGRLKGLAQTGSARGPSMPDVPTMREQGVNFTIGGAWNGLFGPAGMPPAVVQRLNQEVVKILHQPETREFMLNTVAQLPAPTTPAEFSTIIQNDFQTFRRVIDQAQITLD